MSSAAWTGYRDAIAIASRQRGVTLRCRPRRLPPSGPVTTKRSPAWAVSLRQHCLGRMLPIAVTLMTRGPSHALVSPPARVMSNVFTSSWIPLKSSSASPLPPFCGSATETTIASGVAAIAARSLRLTATAFLPTWCAEAGGGKSLSALDFEKRKSTDSVSRSVVTTVRLPPGKRRTAASSPGRTSSLWSLLSCGKSHLRN